MDFDPTSKVRGGKGSDYEDDDDEEQDSDANNTNPETTVTPSPSLVKREAHYRTNSRTSNNSPSIPPRVQGHSKRPSNVSVSSGTPNVSTHNSSTPVQANGEAKNDHQSPSQYPQYSKDIPGKATYIQMPYNGPSSVMPGPRNAMPQQMGIPQQITVPQPPQNIRQYQDNPPILQGNPYQVNTSYLHTNRSIPLNSYQYPVPPNRNNPPPKPELDTYPKPEDNNSQPAFIPGSEASQKPSLPHLPPRSHSADGTAQRNATYLPLNPIRRTIDPFLHSSQSESPSPVTGKGGLPVPNMRPKLKVQIPLGESTDGQITSADRSKGGTLSDELERRNISKDQGPMSAGPLTGTNNGSSWGTLLLPPPSPSSYLTSSTGGGPGNPFGRPSLISSNNGEQTPLSAALPSRYVNELLPSPSNFYGGDWNFQFGGPTSAGGSGTTSQGPSNSLTTPSGSGLMGSGASFLSQRNNHLSMDMLPSPLQFNTPVVASSSQSLTDHKSPTSSTATGGEKRDSGAVAGPSAKRVKLESSIGRRF